MTWNWPAALRFESSDVDWCEANFKITNHVAEFYNTISNVLFFVVPPVLICLFRQYARQVTRDVQLVWLMLVVVGAGSAYFHATLSLVGQLLDEIAIIWVVMIAFALWFPKRHFPLFLKENREQFKKLTLLTAVISTGLACMMPAINCMVLFIMGVPATIVLISELRRCQIPHIFSLGQRCCITWIIALSSWITDRFFCHISEMVGFPYLHCIWHVCILLASYQACVLMAYFNAIYEVSEQRPRLEYWPENWQIMGIPYIKLQQPPSYKPVKHC